MKPEQFIKRYGINEAKKIIDKAPNGTTHIHSVTWQNYKQGDSNNYVWGRSGREGWYFSIYDTLNGMMALEDLKRLLESIDQINAFDGGIKEAKEILSRINKNGSKYATLFERPALEQAIRDHESIYGGVHES
ncbi:hypothetical protein NQ658_06990 [Acinetobacter baumannii]|nr:hypothetical protein [Acinetobacter baumannii]